MGLPGRARDSFGHRPILRIVPSLGDEASADALIRLCDATHDVAPPEIGGVVSSAVGGGTALGSKGLDALARGTRLLVELYMATRVGLRPETRRLEWSVFHEYARAFSRMPARAEQVAPWWEEQRRRVSGTTYWNKWGKVRRFHEWAAEEHGQPNPYKGMLRPRKPRTVPVPLEDHEAERIWNYARTCGVSETLALAMLILGTGVRIGEAANIRRSDIFESFIRIPDGKTGQREVAIPHPDFPGVVKTVGRGDYLWIGFDGKRRDVRSLTHLWRSICAACGIYGRKAGPHAARHRFALKLLEKSGDIRTVQWGLGHASLSSTVGYLTLRPKHIIDNWEKYSPLSDFEDRPAVVGKVSLKRIPRLQVLEEIRRVGGWVAPIEIARALGRPPGTINRLCWTMAREGELVSDGHGRYALPGMVQGGGVAAG